MERLPRQLLRTTAGAAAATAAWQAGATQKQIARAFGYRSADSVNWAIGCFVRRYGVRVSFGFKGEQSYTPTPIYAPGCNAIYASQAVARYKGEGLEVLVNVWDGEPTQGFPFGECLTPDYWFIRVCVDDDSIELARAEAERIALIRYPLTDVHVLSVWRNKEILWRDEGQ